MMQRGFVFLLALCVIPSLAFAARPACGEKEKRARQALTLEEVKERKPVGLDGSKDSCSLLYQNLVADFRGWYRMSDAVFQGAVAERSIVPIYELETSDKRIFRYHPQFPDERRWLLPHAREVLGIVGWALYREFGDLVPLNSGFRSVEFQGSLNKSKDKTNPNAASSSGPLASTHPRGIAFDLGMIRYPDWVKDGTSNKELLRLRQNAKAKGDDWELSDHEVGAVREVILALEKCGVVEATEEVVIPNFHVAVLGDGYDALACLYPELRLPVLF